VGLFCRPNRWRRDRVGGAAAGVFAARAFEAADDFDGHVVVAEDLATQADAGHGSQASGGHDVFFGLGHGFGVAGDELDAAGGAAGVAAAGVELVGLGFVGEGVDEAFAGGDFKVAEVFDGKLGHGAMVANRGEEYRVECAAGPMVFLRMW
jgi:hypothetical protein